MAGEEKAAAEAAPAQDAAEADDAIASLLAGPFEGSTGKTMRAAKNARPNQNPIF